MLSALWLNQRHLLILNTNNNCHRNVCKLYAQYKGWLNLDSVECYMYACSVSTEQSGVRASKTKPRGFHVKPCSRNGTRPPETPNLSRQAHHFVPLVNPEPLDCYLFPSYIIASTVPNPRAAKVLVKASFIRPRNEIAGVIGLFETSELQSRKPASPLNRYADLAYRQRSRSDRQPPFTQQERPNPLLARRDLRQETRRAKQQL